MAGRAICLIAVLSIKWCLQCVVAQDASATAIVFSSRELLSALQDVKVATIVLGQDVELGSEFKQYSTSPLQIQRNVTITGPAGSSAAIDDMPVIDLAYSVGILELCSSCHFVFLWVNIAHENRVGTGLGMSTFLGQPGSRLERLGGVGLRDACSATGPSLKVLNNTKRSALFPSPPDGQQLAGSTDFVFRGKPYQDMLKIIDLSGEIAMTQASQVAFIGGYSIRRRNATRLCDHIVSGQCLQQKTPEECIAEMLSDAQGPGNPPRRATEVAVPTAIGGLLLLLVCAAVVWLHVARKRRRLAALKPVTSSALAGRGDAELNQDPSDGSRKEWPKSSSFPPALVGGALGSGFNQLLWCSSAPNMGMQDNDSIELGVLLGAGSFGRVYKASWCGLDVAVKVIQHDSTSVREVATEVTLMLNLNHPNIVRSYHCRTKQQFQPSQPPSLPSAQQSQPAAGNSLPKTDDSKASWCITNGAAAAHNQTGSTSSSETPSLQQQQQQQQEQQQQQQHSMVLPAGSSGTEQRVPQAAAATPTQPQQLRGTPAAPPAQPANWQLVPSAASVVPRRQLLPTPAEQPAPPAPGTATSDGLQGAGATGSSARRATAWERHVQDLDAGPCCRQQRQMQRLQQGPLQGLQQGPMQWQLQGAMQGLQQGPMQGLQQGPMQGQQQGAMQGQQQGAMQGLQQGPMQGLQQAPMQGQQQAPMQGLQQGPMQGLQQAPMQGQQQGAMQGLQQAPMQGLQQGAMQGLQQAPVQGQQQSAAPNNTPNPSVSTSGASRTPDPQPTSGQAATATAASAGASGQAADSSSVTLVVVDDAGSNSGSSRRHCTASVDGTLCETWLVLELCDRGTLARQASQWQPQANEQDMLMLLHLLRDVARGLKQLQAQNIVHADLNAHNVLVSSSPVASYGLVAKIADLGLSRVLKQHTTHRTTSTVGMMSHQPPELLRDGRMSPAVDIYSFGIMMYELFTRQVAYARMRMGQLYHQVVLQGLRPTPPQDMPEDYELLMCRCWAAEPAERPSVNMLLECLGLMIEDRQLQPDDNIQQQQ